MTNFLLSGGSSGWARSSRAASRAQPFYSSFCRALFYGIDLAFIINLWSKLPFNLKILNWDVPATASSTHPINIPCYKRKHNQSSPSLGPVDWRILWRDPHPFNFAFHLRLWPSKWNRIERTHSTIPRPDQSIMLISSNIRSEKAANRYEDDAANNGAGCGWDVAERSRPGHYHPDDGRDYTKMTFISSFRFKLDHIKVHYIGRQRPEGGEVRRSFNLFWWQGTTTKRGSRLPFNPFMGP